MRKLWLFLLLAVALLIIAACLIHITPYFPRRTDVFVTTGADGQTLKFPDHFYWGVATAGTQVERQQASDWAAFERDVMANRRYAASQELGATIPGNIRNFGNWSEKVRVEHANFDELYPQDIAMAAAMGVNAFRISFEWARLFPRANMTAPSPEAIAYYKDILAEMKRNHITPFVTLYHYVSPEWFFEPDASGKRGWERQDALQQWERYIDAVADNFIPGVEQWCTLNEPMVYLWLGYVEGVYPPLEKRPDISAVADVYEALLRAHAAAYSTLHRVATARNAPANVGLTMLMSSFAPLRNWAPSDRLEAYFVDQSWNWDFLDAIESGRMKIAIAGIDREISGLRGTEDYVGVNYYSRHYVKANLRNPTSPESMEHDPARKEPTSELGWTNFPHGFYDVLTKAYRKYRKPVYILENGTSDGAADDVARQKYLVQHVREAWLAIHQGGADVRSYFQWSLTDNLEWAEGFDARFGLIAVDYENAFKRTPRQSAKVYAEITHENGLTPELLRQTLAKADH